MVCHIPPHSGVYAGESSGRPNGRPRRVSEREGADADAELFSQCYAGLRRFAVIVAPAAVDPDDLIQEAVSRALRRGPLVTLANAPAYLRKSILNIANNERRGSNRQRRAFWRTVAGAEPAVAYPSDVADLLALSSADRILLWMVHVEGAPFAEAADLLGCSEATARKRASRARQHLRHLLEDER
jgi:RNA polymerase sigma-70 factor (ECF subfamily)